MAERRRRITSHRDDGGHRTIEVAIEDDGALRFTGHDTLSGVPGVPGAPGGSEVSDYEYFLVLGPSAVERLGDAIGIAHLGERRDLLDVVTTALHDHAFALRPWFDDHGIEYDFHSYAG